MIADLLTQSDSDISPSFSLELLEAPQDGKYNGRRKNDRWLSDISRALASNPVVREERRSQVCILERVESLSF